MANVEDVSPSASSRPKATGAPWRSIRRFFFIHEIIKLKKDYRQTRLFAEMIAGRRLRRQSSVLGNTKERSSLKSEAAFEEYYSRCMMLADSISRLGVLSMDTSETGSLREDDPDEGDTKICIDENGQLLHYRRGKHRLAVAQALGMERMPATVYFISSAYLFKFMRPWDVLVPGRLRAALRTAIDQAVANANRVASDQAWAGVTIVPDAFQAGRQMTSSTPYAPYAPLVRVE